ncbi:hypothetical protein BDR26DRAFT_870847 [Obelidium mucronatum]|nr:hypothetical protein BDR26DRAFT_870847 [Obelidium mucronatum]
MLIHHYSEATLHNSSSSNETSSINYTALFNAISLEEFVILGVIMGLVCNTSLIGSRNLWNNIASHFFYLLFDAFIVMKAYETSRNNQGVLGGAVVLLVHRDWLGYYQHPVSGIGYNVADMLVVVYSWLVSLGFNLSGFSTNLGNVFWILVQENILRSVLVVGISSYQIYTSLNFQHDQFKLEVSYVIQNLVYAMCVNAELFLMDSRQASKSTLLKDFLLPPSSQPPPPPRASASQVQDDSRNTEKNSVTKPFLNSGS